MFNINTLREGTDLKKSKCLTRIAENGQTKMYQYLSGADADSTYTAQNIKYIMELHGDIDWSKIDDKTNALFNIGYSDQGNIIGLLTNTNALLQDMLVYSPLEEAKTNLREVLKIEVGTESILGKRYAVNGQSPLTFSLPVVTKGNYKTLAVVIHREHAEQFKRILKTIDIDALTKEDMVLIAKDFGFISRTQELAIDVAKDKTIEIVDTSEWVNNGIKAKNHWLSKQDNQEGWFAKDNFLDIINAKKENKPMPEFNIIKDVPEEVAIKIMKEVTTSESLAREVLAQATKDYFNNNYKEMLLYSQETSLNQKAKSMALENVELTLAIKQVIMAYRSYMIDNIPRDISTDKDTAIFLRKLSKEKTTAFASICRNTIYKLGRALKFNDYKISLIAYGTDLLEVSKEEGKYFRAIMPEEFKKLYAAGNTSVSKEPLFYVDEFVKDDIDDEIDVIVDFKEGRAFDSQGIQIAKASHKYNASNAKIVLENGRYYAETKEGVDLPPVGDEVLVRIENISKMHLDEINNEPLELNYTPKSPNNQNLLFATDCDNKVVYGSVGYKSILPLCYRIMLLQNNALFNMAASTQFDSINIILNDYERVTKFNLINKFQINKIETVNAGGDFEAQYAIIKL